MKNNQTQSDIALSIQNQIQQGIDNVNNEVYNF